MNTTFLQVKAVTDTLPIGFYANRPISVTLDEKASASSYNPIKDVITISYRQLTEGINRIDEKDFEMVIRSNFYHEVAHAMLTPKSMASTDIINIFEDERIERVTKNLFYGVNFTEAFEAISGGLAYPTSPQHHFFNLVRHHYGEKKWLDRVDRIIKEYHTLNRNSDRYWDYTDEIEKLYADYTKDFDAEKEKEKMQAEGVGGEGEAEPSDLEVDAEGEGEGESGSESDKEGRKSKGTAKGKFVDEPKDKSKNEKGDRFELSAEMVKEMLTAIANSTFDDKFLTTASTLFENFRRKNSKGSALQGHSGVLNPRLADRPDYRMFERSTTARGNNSFGTFHLNLFIDTSGSFHSNDDATNQIIKSLILIERKNPNFTFDVITMGKEEKILPKEYRYISSSGGNHLSGEIFDIFAKVQLPQTYNYNIVLFDGDAYSNDVYSPIKKRLPDGKGFQAFAKNNCTIISDPSNQKYIEQYAPTTKVIYTRHYVKELNTNVLKALQTALT